MDLCALIAGGLGAEDISDTQAVERLEAMQAEIAAFIDRVKAGAA
jgi:hypothetical protein